MVRFIVAALAAVVFAAPVAAQPYPSKPIRLIVPFPPGGGTDTVSRLVAQELQKSTGWTVVVENKAGAGGMIGLQEASRAQNDGYSMVMAQVDNMVIAPAVQRTGQLDPVKELTPVIQVASSPFLFMTAMDSKYKTLNDWVSEAKANPGKISYGTAGYGTFTHLAVELLQKAGNFQAVQIPYKGAAPAITDLLGGHVPMAALSIASGRREGEESWQTTRFSTRYGCFLPDLTGLASKPSAASSPGQYRPSGARAQGWPMARRARPARAVGGRRAIA